MFNNIAIGPITIHMYGVMIAAGFLAALLMTLRRGKKRGYVEEERVGKILVVPCCM